MRVRAEARMPARVAAPRPAPPPFRRRVAFEELESRLLMSADLNPLASDALFAAPAPNGAEFRVIAAPAPSVVISADPAAIRRTTEIAFVDTATPDYERLVGSMRETALAAGRDLEVVLIGRGEDGLRTITETLARKTLLDAVHIVSHGEAGSVQLGHARLDFVALAAHATQIKGWGQAFGADADLLIYGCNVAASAEGRSLVDALARLTGADVAASDDYTGSRALGGDWDLEYRRGSVETSIGPGALVQSAWQGILAQTFYLGGDTSPPFSNLEAGAPTDAMWNGDNNYDPGRDSIPGLTIKKDNASASQSDSTKHHTWTALAPVGGTAIANEQVTLLLWSAMKDNDAGKDGTITAYLMDLGSATATSGTLIAQATIPLKTWPANFAEQTLDFGVVNHTVAAGRYLGVKVVVGNNSDDDLWFAYDATAYPSRLQIGSPNAPPTIAPTTFSVAENAANGTAVGTVSATDPDPAASFSKFYWTDLTTNEIRRANLDGSSSEALVTGLQDPTAVAVDHLGGKIYWADAGTDRIQRANLDGSGVENLVTTGLSNVVSLKLDIGAGKMYWADSAARTIQRANFDGTGVQTLQNAASGLDMPTGLDLDVAAGRLYWIENSGGTFSGEIRRANLDGTGATTLVSGLRDPWSLALHVAGGKMYWNDLKADAIFRINIDGSGAIDTIVSSAPNVGEVIVDAARGRLLFTDRQNDRVARANLDGSGLSTVVATGAEPSGIDVGPAGPVLTYSITAGNVGSAFAIDPVTGAITVANGGALNFETTPSFSLTVRAQDGAGLASTALVTVNLLNVNEAPVNGVPATQSVNEDSPLALSTIAVSDPESNVTSVVLSVLNGTLAATAAGGAAVAGGGTASVTITGAQAAINLTLASLVYRGNLNFSGTDTLTITATDTGARQDTDSVTINVLPVNDTPAANNVSASGSEDDAQIAITLTGADPEGPLASFRIVGALPGNGVLYTDAGLTTLAVSGVDYAAAGNALTLYFVPAANWSGTTSFQFSASDGGGLTDLSPANATLNVAPLNDAPAGSDGAVATPMNTSRVLTAVDFGFSDADAGDTLGAVRIDSLPLLGTLTLLVGGVPLLLLPGAVVSAGQLAAGDLVFTPVLLTSGTPYTSFTFSVRDAGGPAFDPAPNVLTINVLFVNSAPAGTNATLATNEDVARVFTVADFGFTDPDAGDSLSAVRIDTLAIPVGATLRLSGVDVNALDLILVADIAAGNLVFTPASNQNGAGYASFTYSVRDSGGPAFDPAPNTMTLDVTAVNDTPVANDVGAAGNEDDAQIAITLTGSDVEGPVASFRLAGLPPNGLLYTDPGLTSLAAVATDYAATGNARTFYFVPGTNWNGTTSFQFTAVDAGGLPDATPANATITVAAVNDAPAANDVSAAGNEDDAQIAITLTGSDVEGPVASFRLAGLPANGLLYLDAGLTTLAAVATDYAATGNARTFYFVPTANWNGATGFQFTAVDAGGLPDATPANATINVAAVNDAPVNSVPGPQSVNEDSLLVLNMIAVIDADNNMTSVVLSVLNGTLAATAAGGAAVAGGGTASVTITGAQAAINLTLASLVYQGDFGFSGTDTLTIIAADAGALQDTDSVTISVTPVNDEPAGTDTAVTTSEDVARVFTLADFGFTDVDPLDTMSAVRIDTLAIPVGSTLRLSGVDVNALDLILVADIGNLVFTPVLNQNGPGYASFTFSVRDSAGPVFDPTPNTMTINVAPVNDAPAANDVSASGNEDDAQIAITLTGADLEGALASFRITGALPGNGLLYTDAGLTTLAASGIDYAAGGNALTLYFMPAANWNGTSSFQFTAVDAGGLPDATPANATINVAAVNDAPVAADNAYSVSEDATLSVPLASAGVLGNDSDVDGPALSAVLVAGPVNGVLALAPNGTLTYTPNANFFGIDTFTYRAFDASASSNLATVAITVNNVADHTLVVDTAADVVNGDTSSIDALLANKGVDGLVSLREAMIAANATVNAGTPDLIYFAIAGGGPHTIALASTLPQITDAVVIDGTTEPDFAGTPVIVLDGNGGAGNGLRVAANGSTVRGLAIVDFGQAGVLVSGTGNTIEGNYIGIAPDGVTAAGNQTYGVRVNAGGNVIGGSTAAQRNVISGNLIDGLYIAGGSGNVVQGNYVGTNAAGTAAVANREDGIWINGASNTTVGGTAAGEGNLLSGNLWSGIALSGSGTGTVVVGNRIGLDAAGTGAIANRRHGVDLGSFSGATVGGTAASAANVIAFNGIEGVSVAAGTGHSILGNSIFANGGLGIDLAPGANSDMDAPVIYSVTVNGGIVTIAGEARPGATVEFFEADPDPSGRGEGRTLLGSGVVSGALPGAVDPTARRFSFTFAAGSMVVGDRLTATATDGGGSTSEFALNVVASALTPGIAITPIGGLVTTEDGGTAQFSVVLESQPGADVAIAFSTSDAAEGTVAPASLTFTALNWSVAQIVTVTGVADFLTDGTVAYTLLVAAATSPDPGYNGLDPADIALTNADGVNDAPVHSVPGAQSTAEDSALVFAGPLALSIADPDLGPGLAQVSLSATNGTLTLSGTAGLSFSVGDGTADAGMTFTGTIAALNTALAGMTFLPTPNFNGSAGITITTSDQGGSGSGGAQSDTDSVAISVSPANDLPAGTNATLNTNEDVARVFTVADFGFTDPDAGDSLSAVRIDTLAIPVGATLRLSGVDVNALDLILVADIAAGNLVFTPASNQNGAGYASFTFSVRDSGGPAFDLAPKIMTLDVTAVNDAPVITSNGAGATAAIAIGENTTAVTTVTATDIDSPPAGFVYSIAGGADAALFAIDGATGVLRFVAAPDFEAPADAGADNVYDVTVAVGDGNGGSDTQAIAVTVGNVNDAPVAADDTYVAVEDTPLVVGHAGVLGNDFDADGAALVATLVSGPANGTVTLNADGTFTYTPGVNFTGSDSFRYSVSDGALVSGVATVSITVNPANVAPTAADGNVSTTSGQTYVFTIADLGYTDQDGDPLAYVTITALPASGALELNGVPVAANQDVTGADIAAGRLRYVAPASGAAIASFGFRAHDGIQYAAAANTIVIGVLAVPATPSTPPGGGGEAPADPPAPPTGPGPGSTTASGPGAAPDAGAPPSGGGRSGGGGGGDGGGDGAQSMQAAAEGGAAGAAVAASVAAPTVAAAGLSSATAAEALTLGSREGGLDGLKINDGSAHELAVQAEARAVEALAAPELRQALDKLREEQVQEAATIETRVAGSVLVVSSGLSVGYVLWLLRGGVLLSSLLTSLPAWRLIDPLPVLGRMGDRADQEDDDSLEEMVDEHRQDPPAPDAAAAR